MVTILLACIRLPRSRLNHFCYTFLAACLPACVYIGNIDKTFISSAKDTIVN